MELSSSALNPASGTDSFKVLRRINWARHQLLRILFRSSTILSSMIRTSKQKCSANILHSSLHQDTLQILAPVVQVRPLTISTLAQQPDVGRKFCHALTTATTDTQQQSISLCWRKTRVRIFATCSKASLNITSGIGCFDSALRSARYLDHDFQFIDIVYLIGTAILRLHISQHEIAIY